MSLEAEMPGRRVSREHATIIYARYFFASQFIAGKKVLEIGCGPGLGLGYLAKRSRELVGIDVSEENLRCARRHYLHGENRRKITLCRRDAHDLSCFGEGSFDVVISMATVYALRLDKVLEECRRILKEGGLFVFCMPNKDAPGFRPAALSTRYYSVPELCRVVREYGFAPRAFGGFPASEGIGSKNGARARANALHALNALLRSVRGGVAARGFIDRFVLRKGILPQEITETDMETARDVVFVPLQGMLPNSRFRVLYVLAKKSS